MIALAAHKFVSDIAHDAMQYYRIRTGTKKDKTGVYACNINISP